MKTFTWMDGWIRQVCADICVVSRFSFGGFLKFVNCHITNENSMHIISYISQTLYIYMLLICTLYINVYELYQFII